MPRQHDVDVWMLSDLCTPWCVHVVATLRIAEHLDAGVTRIDELANASACDADALQRVLRHLVSRGLFEEPQPGQFVLNTPARALLDSSTRLAFDLDAFGGRMANAWSGLLTSVRTGASAYHTIFGQPFWEDLQAHPAIGASFDAMMGPAGHGAPDPNIPISDGWNAVRTIVDVGGGTGALLAAILRAQPHVRGTLVDLPATVARSRETFEAAGVAERVTTSAQSFFDRLPPGADLYVLKSVLSDWPDREAIAILTRCADAARATAAVDPLHASGRIILLNGVTPDASGPPPPELLMLVLVGGKQRTLSEFRALAHAAGLEIHAATPQSHRLIVECRPVA